MVRLDFGGLQGLHGPPRGLVQVPGAGPQRSREGRRGGHVRVPDPPSLVSDLVGPEPPGARRSRARRPDRPRVLAEAPATEGRSRSSRREADPAASGSVSHGPVDGSAQQALHRPIKTDIVCHKRRLYCHIFLQM